MVFRKIKPNLFLVIEKATSFQNLYKLMSDTYFCNEWHIVPRKVENLI